MPDVIIAQPGALDVSEFTPEVIEVGYIAQTVAEGGGSVTSVDGQTGAVVLAAVYAALAHNHNGAYSVLAHTHSTLYDPLGAAEAAGANLGAYPPQGYGFVSLSGDPMFYQAPGSFGGNTILFCRMFVPAGRTITGAYFACRGTTSWDTVTTGNKVAVFDDNGANPVASALVETMWESGPWRGAALLSTIAAQAAGRFVYALALVRGYGGGVGFMNPTSANDANTYTAVGPVQAKRRGGYWSGQSAMPASFDPATVGTASGFTVCCGLTGA